MDCVQYGVGYGENLMTQWGTAFTNYALPDEADLWDGHAEQYRSGTFWLGRVSDGEWGDE